MNNAHRPIDSKREEYRKYLERTGVLDAITKTLTHLYEETEKPSDALSFIYKYIGESYPDKVPAAGLEKQLEEEKEKVKKLELELEAAKAKLASYEKTSNVGFDVPEPDETAAVAVEAESSGTEPEPKKEDDKLPESATEASSGPDPV